MSAPDSRFAHADPPPQDAAAIGPELIDTHAHLDLLPDYREALERARRAKVTRVITIGVDPPSNAWAVEASQTLPDVFATVGLHPHDAKLFSNDVRQAIELQAQGGRVVGIGEAGLDYYYDKSPRQEQRDAFAWQIRLAHSTGKALVIHTRDAWEDTFSILESEGVPGNTVFHCWSGGPEQAQRSLEMGCVLSFSGTVSFKNAELLRQAALLTPVDRLVVETDAPFLTPAPYRGKRNEPGYVRITAAYLAELKSLSLEELAVSTTRTADALFSLA